MISLRKEGKDFILSIDLSNAPKISEMSKSASRGEKEYANRFKGVPFTEFMDQSRREFKRAIDLFVGIGMLPNSGQTEVLKFFTKPGRLWGKSILLGVLNELYYATDYRKARAEFNKTNKRDKKVKSSKQ